MKKRKRSNSTYKTLMRWRALDAALGTNLFLGLDVEGVNALEFAGEWHVTERTIHRDLKAFWEMGLDIVQQRDDDGRVRHYYKWYNDHISNAQEATMFSLFFHNLRLRDAQAY